MNPNHILAALLLALGALIALGNWWSLYRSYRTKRFYSPVPLVGAGLLGTGLFLLPATRPFCWSALLLDYGTLMFFLAALRVAEEFWKTSRFNQDSEYVGRAGRKYVRLRLFRHGVFILHLDIQRRPDECDLVSTGTIGTWEREGTRLTLQTRQLETVVFTVAGTAAAEILRASAWLASWEGNPDLSLVGMELARQP